jgi:hypothetical protein
LVYEHLILVVDVDEILRGCEWVWDWMGWEGLVKSDDLFTFDDDFIFWVGSAMYGTRC